jgi:hypothetical protein
MNCIHEVPLNQICAVCNSESLDGSRFVKSEMTNGTTTTASPEVVGLPYPTLYYPASTEDWRNPYDGKGMYFAMQADAYIDSIKAAHSQTKAVLAEAVELMKKRAVNPASPVGLFLAKIAATEGSK